MSHCLIWIDHEHAKIFHFTGDGKSEHTIKNHHHDTKHPANAEQANKNDLQKYYHEIANQVKTADHLLIVGPGMAHVEFKSHLENHHHADLAKKIIGSEPMEKGTNGEIINMAKKYFQKYNLFN